ncbi:hypothetical protein KEM52_003668 [Ascosphaera acerosa]|nr:hypothetical protein KEM52_003668 [Ascosphaera acerosa]
MYRDASLYFLPKTMYNTYRGTLGHFQLRNLMSVTASNTVQYAEHDRIHSVTPFYGERHCVLELRQQPSHASVRRPLLISAMKAKYGVTVTGDVGGEYAMASNETGKMARRSFGDSCEMITHVDITLQRSTSRPHAVVASNDKQVRTLDCETTSIVQSWDFARAVNCSDGSPDGRMRVLIGDAPEAWVIDTDSGQAIRKLGHHDDFGFACAWSPDMLHIATANQDKTVNVWDTRMWRLLTSIQADVACHRSLRYSPLGGGPRTLLMCEPADHVSVVDARSYNSRQAIDFFGEIGGADYTPDGRRLWILNVDPTVGGLMEYDQFQPGSESSRSWCLRRSGLPRGFDQAEASPNDDDDETHCWTSEVRLPLRSANGQTCHTRQRPIKTCSPAWQALSSRKRRTSGRER